MSNQEDVLQKKALSQKYYEIAVAVSARIQSAELKIGDLSVAFTGSTAHLSGVTPSAIESAKAAALALEQPEVENVGNGITVVPEDTYREWRRDKDTNIE